jgi:3D (Asp-Asp-Asp) domain-containing protein
MPAASPVNLHSPAVPVRAVLLILALSGLTAIFSLRPFNIPAPAAFVLTSAPFPGEGNPKGLPTAPPVESEVKLGRAQGHLLGSFRVTFYWLVEENKYPGERTAPLYALSGELLGYFPDRFVQDFRMESCALLRDGRVISNWEAGNRCQVVDAPVGCNGLTLYALRSVAVDPSVVPMGAKLYIPEADGASLGGDACHDGLFYVHDVGGLIRGKRIDIYLGSKSNMKSFVSTSLCRSSITKVYILP